MAYHRPENRPPSVRTQRTIPDRMLHYISLIVILFECCFVIVIDCIYFNHCIAFYLVPVYNCGLANVLPVFNKHLIWLEFKHLNGRPAPNWPI